MKEVNHDTDLHVMALVEMIEHIRQSKELCGECLYGGVILSLTGTLIVNAGLTDEALEALRAKINLLFDNVESLRNINGMVH